MKRLSADDSADSRVKVGHRQATYKDKKPLRKQGLFVFLTPVFLVTVWEAWIAGGVWGPRGAWRRP